jgi:hypothetical protein
MSQVLVQDGTQSGTGVQITRSAHSETSIVFHVDTLAHRGHLVEIRVDVGLFGSVNKVEASWWSGSESDSGDFGLVAAAYNHAAHLMLELEKIEDLTTWCKQTYEQDTETYRKAFWMSKLAENGIDPQPFAEWTASQIKVWFDELKANMK